MIHLWQTWKTFGVLFVLIVAFFVLMASSGLERWATAQTPAASGAGNTLMGKLEGPEVIVDPAQFPKTFKQAPQLVELVKAGKLPPVAERIGQDPLVLKPVHEIGKYGGMWRRGFTGPADFWNGLHSVSGPDHILFWDYTGYKAVPNIARDWELSDSGRTTTILLRRGMKWSDDHPFTADDFLFWYEDIYKNKELNPTPSLFLSINGKPGEVEKVDTYTVRFRFVDPYPVFPEMLAGATPIGGGHVLGAANETQLSAWNNDGTEHPWGFPFHLVWLSISTLAPGGPEYARWFQSGGKEGKEPTGRIREMMDLWVQGMGVSEEERITLGKRLWQIAAEDVYIIGITGPGAASGVRVAKVNMGNLSARMYISPDGKAESISRPVAYYYKN